MKFEILQSELLKGLSSVTRAVATRAQLPILSNVLISAQKDGVVLAATDLELAVRTRVFGKVEGEGVVAAPAKMLSDLVSAGGEGKVVVELEKETLKLKTAKYAGKLQTVAAAEFPEFAKIPDKGGYTVKMAELRGGVERVGYAAAKDLLRPALTGVYLEQVKGGVKLVATDGFRLGVAKVAAEGEVGGTNRLVPARAILDVSRIEAEEVRIVAVSESQVGFVAGETVVVTQVIDGSFPEYGKIVPTEYATSLEVLREELLTGLKAVQIFARENSNIVRWSVGGQRIVLEASAPERGEARAEVEAAVEGEGGEIVFNAKFVADFLQNSAAETVTFRMNDNLKPGAFGEKGNEDYLYIVMPINA